MTIDSRTADLVKVADALDALDSHGIYARDALDDLAAAGIDIDKLSSETVPQVQRAIRARGLGGYVEHEKTCSAQYVMGKPETCRCCLYTGHVVSAEVVRLLGFVDAGGAFFGRGSAHRARIAQLRNGGAPK